MERKAWLNLIVIVAVVAFIAFWTWWLFKPTPMPFALRSRWKLQNIAISKIAFSPKGDLLAFSTLTHNFELVVTLWKLPEGKEVKPNIVVSRKVQPLGIPFRQIAFSPDGRLLAVGYQEQGIGKVGIFSVSNGQRVRTITVGKSKWQLTPSVIFSPNGDLLAIVHDLQLWFVRVGDWKPTKSTISVPEITFSPNGHFIAVAYATMPIFVYDRSERLVGKLSEKVTIGNATVDLSTVAFSKDEQRIACVWREERAKTNLEGRVGISVWKVQEKKLEHSLPLTTYKGFFPSATFSLDASLVALEEEDKSSLAWLLFQVKRLKNKLLKRPEPTPVTQVFVRRISDGQLVARLPRFGYNVTDCAFSPDGRYLVVVHDNIKVALWELKKGQ